VLVAIIKKKLRLNASLHTLLQNLVADALRETAVETNCCGRRPDRKQPRISQSTESIRVL